MLANHRGQQLMVLSDDDHKENPSLTENLSDYAGPGKGTTGSVKGVLEEGQGRVHNRGTQDHNDVASGGQQLLADLAVEESVGFVRQNGLARALRAGIRENDQGALAEMSDGVPALASRRGEETGLAGGLVGGVLLEEEVEARGGSSET